MNELMPELWNIKQLSDYYHVTRQTIYNWVKRGWIPKPDKRRGYPMWDSEKVVKALGISKGKGG